jgi:hypothetical protein
MPDNINRSKKEVTDLTVKTQKDLAILMNAYDRFQSDIEERFREEMREQDGKIDGLEDFYSLNMIVKRNAQMISNSLGMLKRLKDISEFNIEEMTDTEYKKIKELIE